MIKIIPHNHPPKLKFIKGIFKIQVFKSNFKKCMLKIIAMDTILNSGHCERHSRKQQDYKLKEEPSSGSSSLMMMHHRQYQLESRSTSQTACVCLAPQFTSLCDRKQKLLFSYACFLTSKMRIIKIPHWAGKKYKVLGTAPGTWLSMMKVLTAIITISKRCRSSVCRLTVNHFQLSEEKTQIKAAFKIRAVTKF